MTGALVALALEFDLPFTLQVTDGFGPLRPDGYQDFQFVAQGLPITLRFARKVRTEHSALIDMHAPQDSASYTRAQVWFEGPQLEALPGWAGYRPHARALVDLALSAVNRYIMLYRELAGAHWLRALVAADVPEFAFAGFYEGGDKDTYLVEQPGRDISTPLAAAAEQALRERFVSTYEPDPLQALAFTVRDLFERGEYWQSVAALEVLVEARVWALLPAAARQYAQVGAPPLSLVAGLRRVLPDLCGVDLNDDADPLVRGLRQWETSALGLSQPGGIPHNVTAYQAEDALVAGLALLYELQARLAPPAGELPPEGG